MWLNVRAAFLSQKAAQPKITGASKKSRRTLSRLLFFRCSVGKTKPSGTWPSSTLGKSLSDATSAATRPAEKTRCGYISSRSTRKTGPSSTSCRAKRRATSSFPCRYRSTLYPSKLFPASSSRLPSQPRQRRRVVVDFDDYKVRAKKRGYHGSSQYKPIPFFIICHLFSKLALNGVKKCQQQVFYHASSDFL